MHVACERRGEEDDIIMIFIIKRGSVRESIRYFGTVSCLKKLVNTQYVLYEDNSKTPTWREMKEG